MMLGMARNERAEDPAAASQMQSTLIKLRSSAKKSQPVSSRDPFQEPQNIRLTRGAAVQAVQSIAEHAVRSTDCNVFLDPILMLERKHVYVKPAYTSRLSQRTSSGPFND